MKTQLKNVSLGLMKLFSICGIFIFITVGFYIRQVLRGISIEEAIYRIIDPNIIAFEEICMVLFFGFFGFAYGLTTGARIQIKNDKVAKLIDTIVNYGISTSIWWMTLSGLAFQISLGKEGLNSLISSTGIIQYLLGIFLTSMILTGVILVEIYVIAQLIEKKMGLGQGSSFLSFLWRRICPYLTFVLVGILQFKFFQANIFWGIAIGLVAPTIIIPISNYTIQTDFREREKLQRQERNPSFTLPRMSLEQQNLDDSLDRGNSIVKKQCGECGTPMTLFSPGMLVNTNALQGSFQCAVCGRCYCYEHSDSRKTCKCGKKVWIERLYISQ